MGLLDDAIREHLELKRRSGADPGEIERAEREALGPVRRMPEPGDEPPYDAPFGARDDADEDEPDFAYASEDDPAEHGERFEPLPSSYRLTGEGREDDAADFFDQASLGPPAGGSHETAEHHVEHDEWEHEAPVNEAPPAASRAQRSPHDGEEDVLEETPEFLQDTPDHDRLWFEQRPPRDFNFER